MKYKSLLEWPKTNKHSWNFAVSTLYLGEKNLTDQLAFFFLLHIKLNKAKFMAKFSPETKKVKKTATLKLKERTENYLQCNCTHEHWIGPSMILWKGSYVGNRLQISLQILREFKLFNYLYYPWNYSHGFLMISGGIEVN